MGSGTGAARCAGFDAARVAAAGLVFFQHGCSLLGLDHLPEVGGVRLGRVGTAAFFALSGYLVAATSRAPGRWLRDRAAKLLPAYWVVTALAFAAAAATGAKSFDAAQVVSQLAGTGLVTHPGQLVNSVTWFVTPLFLLYLIAAGGQRRPWVMPLTTAALVAVALSDARHGSTAAGLALAFPAGYYAARYARYRAAVLVAAGGAAALLAPLDRDLRYLAAALPLLAAATAWPERWPAGRWFARYTWEWFLLHGLALHLAVRLGADTPATLFPVGAAVSLVAAVALREGLGWAAGGFRLPRRAGGGIMASSSPPAALPPRVESCSASSAARSDSATGPPAAISSSPAV